MRGNALNWFRNFLLDRRQRTIIGQSVSALEYLHAGVPQGTILSPLLFSLYMNDITASKCGDVNLFTDDTSAFTVPDSAQNLQLSLQTVANDPSSWFKSWPLTINVEKTAVMVLCTRQKVPTISIIINGSEIKQVRVQKHLGLNIDERLTWTDHVSTIVNKTSSRLGLLRRLRPRVPPLVIQTLFRTCVLPVLEYASLAWRGIGTINAERLERLQRTAARLITGTRLVENVPREILLARAGLDKLADCQKIKCGIFAFKLAFRKNSNCLPRHVLEVASSQALPAQKVAIDDECSGKGLAFTKNNPPDFGLLFLAQFARFSIRTETEVTVHTHSQTNRHATLTSLPSTIRPLEVWFCWTSRVECSMGQIDL